MIGSALDHTQCEIIMTNSILGQCRILGLTMNGQKDAYLR